jgi:hypothetical protein
MSEKDGRPVDVSVDDEDLIDVLEAEDGDLGDEAIDLDEELLLDDHVIVQQYMADEDEVADAGGLAFGVEDDLVDDLNAGDAGGLAFGVEEDEADEEERHDVEEDVDDDRLLATTSFVDGPAESLTEERLSRIEDAARILTEAEVEREQRKVHRKVKAATTGAGALGFIPVLLQLVGAVELDAELAATASTVAALAGALGLGWLTPEREQLVAEAPATKRLLDAQAHEDEPAAGRRVTTRRRARRARSRRKTVHT